MTAPSALATSIGKSGECSARHAGSVCGHWLGRNAFLYVDDATAYRNVERDIDEPLEASLSHNQGLLGQSTGNGAGHQRAHGQKGAGRDPANSGPLSGFYAYGGLHWHLATHVDEQGVRLKALAKKFAKDMGLIVRTVAEGKRRAGSWLTTVAFGGCLVYGTAEGQEGLITSAAIQRLRPYSPLGTGPVWLRRRQVRD